MKFKVQSFARNQPQDNCGIEIVASDKKGSWVFTLQVPMFDGAQMNEAFLGSFLNEIAGELKQSADKQK